MKRTAGSLVVFVLMISTSHTVAAAEDAARDLVRKALDALPRASFHARLKVSNEPGASRELDVRHKLVDGARSSYLEVVAPDDLAGIRFLFLHRIDQPPLQYIKVAASRRSVLVSNEARAQPFLDSAYYVADVIEPELDAFTYRIVGEDMVYGRKCTLVEAIPKNPVGQIYGKTVGAIDPTENLLLRREFYDRHGTLVKVATVDQLEKIDGIWTIRKQTMKNLKDQLTSSIEVTNIQYDVDIPDDVFLPEYLLR